MGCRETWRNLCHQNRSVVHPAGGKSDWQSSTFFKFVHSADFMQAFDIRFLTWPITRHVASRSGTTVFPYATRPFLRGSHIQVYGTQHPPSNLLSQYHWRRVQISGSQMGPKARSLDYGEGVELVDVLQKTIDERRKRLQAGNFALVKPSQFFKAVSQTVDDGMIRLQGREDLYAAFARFENHRALLSKFPMGNLTKLLGMGCDTVGTESTVDRDEVLTTRLTAAHSLHGQDLHLLGTRSPRGARRTKPSERRKCPCSPAAIPARIDAGQNLAEKCH